MQQVIQDHNSHCAIEVARTPVDVVLARFAEEGAVELITHPLKWQAKYNDIEPMPVEREFDRIWRPLLKSGEPYPVVDAARKFISGTFTAPSSFRSGALEALVGLLPSGDFHLFSPTNGFIGRFSDIKDARRVIKAYGIEGVVMFGSAAEFQALSAQAQQVVLQALDPERKWSAKINDRLAKEVFGMSKKAQQKKTPKPVAKAAAKNKRADGPVAKARALFESMKGKDTADIIAACEKLGINKGTANTQLGRWRKEQGIVVKRGGPRKAKPATAPAKKASKKKAKKDPEPATKPDVKLDARQGPKGGGKVVDKAGKQISQPDPVGDMQQPGAAELQQEAPGPVAAAADAKSE